MSTQITEETIKRFLNHLSSCVPFGVPQFSDMLYLAWYDVLKKFTYDELRWYATFASETLRHFPPLADINKALMDRRSGLHGEDPVSLLMEAVRTKNVQHDAVSILAERMGGWQNLGLWTPEQWNINRKAIETQWDAVKRIYQIRGPQKSSSILGPSEPLKNEFRKRSKDELDNFVAVLEKLRHELNKKTLKDANETHKS